MVTCFVMEHKLKKARKVQRRQRQEVVQALAEHGWSEKDIAKALEITPRHLRRLKPKVGVEGRWRTLARDRAR